MYRILSWILIIVSFYQAIARHSIGFMITGIVVLALMLIAVITKKERIISDPADNV